MSSPYNRNTELRNVHTKDLYNLAVILDDDNYWQTLMEVIPQEINNQRFGTKEDIEKISLGTAYERKYSNDHIRLIENAIRRPGESRLYTQILFDEWGSSGRKHERPTLGVLLHLLVQTKLYRAADFVADLLNEPKPSRPTNGPAAEFEFEVDVFNDIQETVNDTRFYPDTEDLQENVSVDINKDYYTKYKNDDKKLSIIDDSVEEPTMNIAPKPPPRLHKSARLIKQHQKQQLNLLLEQTATKNNRNSKNSQEYTKEIQQELNTLSNNESVSALSTSPIQNMPKLSALLNIATTETTTTTNKSTQSDNVFPKLSALNIVDKSSNSYEEEEDEDDSLNSTPSLIYTKPNISEHSEQQHPEMNSIPILVLSKTLNPDRKKEDLKSSNYVETHDLPAISALNVNGENDDDEQHLQHYKESNNYKKITSEAFNFTTQQRRSFDEHALNDEYLDVTSFVANTNNPSIHQLDSIEEDYNGIELERDNDVEAELEDDDDSIPNLSFLDNRSSNNESSLTSVTNTSGENSFDQSVNECSSTSTDNVPFLSVFNQ